LVRTACRMIVVVSLLSTASTAVWTYPHQLAYFNPLHGGLQRGHERLLHSNVDWKQDWLLCHEALFGRTRSVSHDYEFVYTTEIDTTLPPGRFRDLGELRTMIASAPPATPFGLCVGRTLTSQILQGIPALSVSEDVRECIRHADSRIAITPAVLLFRCRTPDSNPDAPSAG
jgi:hypothetical protein